MGEKSRRSLRSPSPVNNSKDGKYEIEEGKEVNYADADEDLPAVLEGLVATPELLARKRASGPTLTHNLGLIELEWATHLDTSVPYELPTFFRELEAAIDLPTSEVSHSVAGLTSCLDLVKTWSILVRRSQVNNEVLWLQRSEENTPALLVLQRMEHLKGNCDEMSPVALIIIMADSILFVNRDRFLEREIMFTMLRAAALNQTICALSGEIISTETVAELDCGCCFTSEALDKWELKQPTCPICEVPIARSPNPKLPASALRGYDAKANEPLTLEEHQAGLALIDAMAAKMDDARSKVEVEDATEVTSSVAAKADEEAEETKEVAEDAKKVAEATKEFTSLAVS
jgi:hypothetical protein